MISFAGGLPATEALPDWTGSFDRQDFQYGRTEGEPELRAAVSEQLRALGLDAPPERVLILTGSQQGIDLVAKLLVDPGTPVAVHSPTYLAALQVFRLYGARLIELSANRRLDAPLAYVIPTFANPTGECASEAEREALAAACLDSGATLFEDDPYRELAYDPCDRTPVAARMDGGSWVYQGSFSKTFGPGLRLGFLAASEDTFGHLATLKQATDLHSSRLSQRIVHAAITDSAWPARISELSSFYRTRREGFERALERHFSDLAQWRTPAGGLFYWLRLHVPLDTRPLLEESIARGVAFMPGEEFFPGEPRLGTLRLNFSHAEEEQADRGLGILAALLRERVQGGALQQAADLLE
jgi:DNA-binding transcriptional MocR family regulator